MSDLFVPVRCNRTLEFAKWGKPYQVWIPRIIERRKTLNKAGAVVKISNVTVPVMPGYAFVGLDWWQHVNMTAPAQFYIKPLDSDDKGFPRVVTLAELVVMQECIEALPASYSAETTFKVGEAVKVRFGPFEGHRGVVVRVRGGMVRALYGTLHITLPGTMLDSL